MGVTWRFPTERQLSAIARQVITADPAIDDAEWKERVKRALVAQALLYPAPAVLATTLTRVECALARTWGPRPCAR